MKNQWMQFFSGSVRVNITGKGIERFINLCTRNEITIWNVRHEGSESVTFFVSLKDLSSLRKLIRKSDCKLKFIARKGLPFVVKKAILNFGFLAGFVLFFIIITILSNMVWGIKIEGAKPETEHLIRKELDQIGVESGKLQFFIDDVETIQRKLTNNIEEITWVGVELKGTTYHLKVVEKNQPEPPEYFSPRNIVAKRKAIITSMFVEEGAPLVQKNDFVEKGQILVSGEIGKEGQYTYVPARGEIFGETWYKSTATVELSSKFNVLTGNNKSKHFLNLFGISIPVWGFKNHDYKHTQVEKIDKHVKFLKWQLPISYQKKVIHEAEKVERNYTEKEAIEVGKELSRTKLLDQLGDEAKIKEEKVLRHITNNGKVELEIKYSVIENIVTTVPLVQGD